MQQQIFNGKNLSQIASEIWVEVHNTNFALMEAGWFGCPEVGVDIARQAEHGIDQILSEAGLTREEYDELIAGRISGKWAFDNGLFVS